MSKTVDQRVVEMRFDNKDFEKNVQTSMSTLEKLKSALKLDGVSNGLKNLSNSAKKVDFSGMADGIETVNARFSAMQVVGMTALSNITSAAMRAGMNLVKSFTIEPVMGGFKEYELQMNSIQTILANTKSKGTTMDQVTAALNELNEYADLTIYNFAEMTKNIGTFTAAGVDLDTSVGAIKGIANLGAMSSSTSAQVSTAMYQLSQALATGRVSLMDWNSVVNAGMGGEQFQNALKRTAENFGYDVDSMIKKYGSFRESLTQGGWLTAEVLTETLNQIGGAYDENALRAKGYSEENIKAILDMAQTATDAATDVKTFTQLMDTLNEAVGSGWAQVWQNVFGDFEEAKEFFSSLHEMLEPIVTGPVNAINEVISGAMGMGGKSRWGDFTKQLDKAGVSVDTFQKKLSEVASGKGVDLSALIKEYGSLEKAIASGDVSADMITQTLKELAASTGDATVNTEELNRTLAAYQKVVDQVWYGTYGNVDTGRIERLKAAGWEYAEVQKLVNMTVDGHRLTLEDLSAAQIISLGYTKEQAEALVALAKEAEAAGKPMNTLIDDILNPKLSGRELFLEGLKNTLTAIIRPLQAVGAAFGEVFGMDAKGLYKLIDGFNKFSKAIVISDEDAANLQRTFKGLFSIVHILTSTFGNTFVVAIKGINAVLAPFGTNILAITGFLGDGLYELDRWITAGNFVQAAIDGIGTALAFITAPLHNFVSAFASFPGIATVVSRVNKAIESLKTYFAELLKMSPTEAFKKIGADISALFDKIKNLKWTDVLSGFTDFGKGVEKFFTDLIDGFKELGPDILEGLQNGLTDGVEAIFKFMQDLGTKIIEVVKAILGIHSPSTVFFEIGKNIIDGLCNGIEYTSGRISQTIAAIIEDIKTATAGVDWGAVFTVGAGIGSFIVLYQLTDALQTFATGVKGFSAPFQSAANIMNTTNDFLKKLTEGNSSQKGFANIAQGIKLLAEAIAILAGAVAVLALIEPAKIWPAIGAIAALAAIIGVLAAALNKFAGGGSVLESLQINSTLMALAGSFLLLAVTTKIISGIDDAGLKKATTVLGTYTVIVGLLTVISRAGKYADKAAKFMSRIGTAFLLFAATTMILSGISDEGAEKAIVILGTYTVIVGLLTVISRAGKYADKAAKFIGRIGGAFLMLAITSKIIGGLSDREIGVAVVVLGTFTIIVSLLIAVTRLGGTWADRAGLFIAKIGVAFLALGVAAHLLGGLSAEQFENAKRAMTYFAAVIAALIAVTRIAPPGEVAKVGTTILAMSLAIGVLAGVSVLLGMVDPEGLKKGIKAVAALGLIVAAMSQATRGAEDIKGTMIGIAVAVGVLAASLAVLSFIDAQSLYSAAGALGAVMAVMAVLVKSAGGLKGGKGGSLAPLIAMIAMVAAVAGVLYILAGLPVESSLGAATALSAVLVALAASVKLMNGVGPIVPGALLSMGGLVIIMGLVGLVLSALGALGIQSAIPNAVALSTLILAMAGACKVIGTLKDTAVMGLAPMYGLLAIMAVLALILAAMNGLGIQNAIPNAIALSTLIIALAAAIRIVAPIGPMAASLGPAALAIGELAVVISAIVGVLGLIGQITEAAEVFQKGAEILGTIGEAIGNFIGSLVGSIIEGIGDAVTSVLPKFATSLSEFMTNLKPFLDGAKSLDPSIVSAIGTLASAILTLTGASILDALTSWIPGTGDKFADFANDLVTMGDGMVNFEEAIKDVNPARVSLGATALKTLVTAMSQIPSEGGLLGAILGGKNYDKFSEGMESIGDGLAAFDEATDGVTVESINPRVEALKLLIEALSGVPSSGGMLGALLGDKDYGDFADGLEDIAEGMSTFDEKTKNVTVESMNPRIEALKLLIQALSDVPNSGGLLSGLLGDQDYSQFSNGMAAIARGFAYFCNRVSSIEDFGIVNNSVTSLKKVIETLSEIPTSGGWLDAMLGDGEIDYQGFANGMGSVATALVNYSETASGIDAGQIAMVTKVAKDLINFVKSLGENAEEFGAGTLVFNGIKSIGETISAYSTSLSSVDPEKLSSVAVAIKKLVSLIESMKGMDSSGIETFKTAITDLAGVNVDGVVTAFSDAASKLSNVGTSIMDSMTSGITNGASRLTDSITKVLSGAHVTALVSVMKFKTVGESLVRILATGVKGSISILSDALKSVIVLSATIASTGTHGSLYNTGYNLAAGLARGIRGGQSLAVNAARNMVQAAIVAANAAADVHSPSRVFYKIGDYMAQGMANALSDSEPSVYSAGRSMTEKAVEGARRAATMLSTVVDSDLDVTPTITPVLDLNNVQSGVAALDGMLSGSSLGVLGQVNSISRSMNSRNQNGANADVVSALERVYRKLDDMPVNQYNVNGITYDDGSNIARTVGDLTRQLRIERRS